MLEHYGVPRRYEDDQIIFGQGSKGDEMFVVRTGKVRIHASHNGHDVTLAILGPHEFFGEMSLLTGEARSASAHAQGAVELTAVDAETFNRLVGDPLVHDMLARMSQRIRDVDRELEKLSGQDSIRREHLSHLIEQRNWFA